MRGQVGRIEGRVGWRRAEGGVECGSKIVE